MNSPSHSVPSGALPSVPDWIYLYSRFTSEALYLEFLVILLCIAGYTAFWIVKRRRFGAVGETMPAGPIKAYLNELIGEAEALRTQLFGLLSNVGRAPTEGDSRSSVEPAQVKSSHLFDTMKRNMTEQVQLLQKVTAEKNDLAKELEKLKQDLNKVAEAEEKMKSQNDEAVKMEQKIHELEEKLGEYNIIEDDLANLKRFQQENIKMKSLLEEAGIPLPSLGPSPVPLPSTASLPGYPTASAPPSFAKTAVDVAASSAAPMQGDTDPSERPPRDDLDILTEEPLSSSMPEPDLQTSAEDLLGGGGDGGGRGGAGASSNPDVQGAALEPTEPPTAESEKLPEGSEPKDMLAMFGSLTKPQAPGSTEPIGPDQAQKAEDDLVKEFEKMLRK